MEMVTEPFSPEDSVAMELSSIASACLLSLVVAMGDTGKMLSALTAMLTAPPALSQIKVKVCNLTVILHRTTVWVPMSDQIRGHCMQPPFIPPFTEAMLTECLDVCGDIKVFTCQHGII